MELSSFKNSLPNIKKSERADRHIKRTWDALVGRDSMAQEVARKLQDERQR